MAYQSEIEKLEQRYRENPQQWFAALADSYRKAGSLELAIDVVRAGLDKRPSYVSGHIVHGRCLIDQQKDGEAQAVFERVLELDAENVIAIKALAEIGGRTGQTEVARRWVGRLLEVDPMNEEAQAMMAGLAEAGPAMAAAPQAAPTEAGSETELSAAGALLAGISETDTAREGEPPGPVPEREAPREAGEAFAVERTGEAGFNEAMAELPTLGLERLGDEDSTAEPAEARAAAAMPPAAPDQPPAPDLKPFDDSLSWGTGERVSRQVSAVDIERAEHAHEASLDEVVHALPGLESAEVPAPETEPAAVEQPAEAGASIDADLAPDSGGGDVLPLFYPEEPVPAAVASSASAFGGSGETALGGSEPEPVVTETMAELYVSQGLHHEARETYRKLLAQRPGDPALLERLAALGPGSATPQPARRTLVAAATGGASVRDFLSDVFAGRPSREVAAPPALPELAAPAAPAELAAPAPPVAVQPTEVSEPSILEAAFEEGSGPGVSGEPTRRASDEVSLAAVFGEEPSPPKAPEQPGGRPGSGKSFSFDEFFGTSRPSRETGPSSADDDDFKRWLKSLKS
ncbi:MAG TPA: tetratricopeptide repeat protein [Gemmatimonadales bacterium]